MIYREADGSDKVAAFERAGEIFEKLKRSPKAGHKFLNKDEAINFLFDGSAHVQTFIVAETFLVSYVVTPVWSMGGAPVIYELMIARLYDNGGELSQVLDFLNQEARTFQCVGVIAGTGFRPDDRGLALAYQAAGFTPLSWEHFKPTE